MSYYAVKAIPKQEQEVKPLTLEQLEAFGWGMLAGSIVTIAVGGVIIYFAWPYISAAIVGKKILEV